MFVSRVQRRSRRSAAASEATAAVATAAAAKDRRTEGRFSSFLSGGFTTIAVINPPERKLAKRTFVRRVKHPS